MSRLFFSLSLLLPLIAIAKPGAPDLSEFSGFVDRYFDSTFEWQPAMATVNGFHLYDSKASDLSSPAIARRIRTLHSQREELGKLRAGRLTPDEQMDLNLIGNRIESELLDLQVLKVWRINPMFYVQVTGDGVDGLMKRAFAPARERLRSAIARLGAIPDELRAMRQNIVNPPKDYTELAITIADGMVTYLQKDVRDWGMGAAGGDAALRKQFTDVDAKAISAMRDASRWLKTELLPRSKGQYALGAGNFLKKLEYDDRVTFPLAKLREIAGQQIERDHKAFVATAKTIDPKRSPAEVMKSLSLDHPTEAGLVPAAKASLKGAEEYLIQKKIVSLPSKRPPIVKDTPSYLRDEGFAMLDAPGPFEKKTTQGFYYVSLPDSGWDKRKKEEYLRLFNLPVLKIITVHEVYPGHYTQFLFEPRFPTKTRKLISCNTNVEGWAHYGEQMMVEEGFGEGDPEIRLAQLSEALVRDARFVATLGLHTAGMSVDDATSIFVDKAFMERVNAHEEAQRGTYDPLYLDYTLGKLMIYKLREDYRATKGKAFSLREFHDAFLEQGPIPVPLVRQILLPGDTRPVL